MKNRRVIIPLSIFVLMASVFVIVWPRLVSNMNSAKSSGYQNSLKPVSSSSLDSTERQEDNWHMIVQDKSPLNSPPLAEVRESDGKVVVAVQNKSAELLYYKGSGENYPQHFLEDFKNGAWVAERWDWCGTGMGKWPLPPGQTVEFKMPNRFNDGRKERIYTKFTSEDGTKASFVLLDENP
jgi:hypothetical protein